jgi:hypothetical protein
MTGGGRNAGEFGYDGERQGRKEKQEDGGRQE